MTIDMHVYSIFCNIYVFHTVCYHCVLFVLFTYVLHNDQIGLLVMNKIYLISFFVNF